MRRWYRHVVFSSTPEASSFAGLVLLSRQYYRQDHSIYSDLRMSFISRRWLKKRKQAEGELRCWKCQRLLDLDGPRRQKATVDHQPPIKDGGCWYDESIFRVACMPCNNQT